MEIVILDLEWNAAFYKDEMRFLNEIIEFGAVKLDENLNCIGSFSALLKPKISRRMNRRTAELTGIAFNDLKQSDITFCEALKNFTEFLGDAVLLTWGTTDITTLIDNYFMYYAERTLPFMTQYCNVQEFAMKQLNLNDPAKQLGVKACVDILEIVPDENLHRADSDAYVEALIFKTLYNKEVFEGFIQNAADPEFYRKLFYKPVFINSLDNPLIKRSAMRFYCPHCASRLRMLTHWQYKNRGFVAHLQCKKCVKFFAGKYTFKKMYDYLNIQTRLSELLPEQPHEENVVIDIESDIDTVSV
ncbi:MAG: hypothetical protein LBM65_04670 [Oscillospiraceae bacterium]|jgi:DNA polymerase III epsilon subunit-like protein|nr:hypothetical protein [Oscillospiraceae bacterium]